MLLREREGDKWLREELIIHDIEFDLKNREGYHASVHDLSNASSSSAAAAAAAQQHSSTTPDSHPLVLGGVTPLTAGGTQTSISLTAVSSPSGSSSAGGQRLDSTPHSVETPNQLLTAQQQDNVSDTDWNIFHKAHNLFEDVIF
ncbi:unnamed protein product [Onchocerca ochengi]|uniref:Myocyte enhancer factor 2d n=1 Tax=Onchocerca ochengi TaxID=42157 RepID=A0A182EMM4_ONCOC|nr:unnamed protein product [Onchocerca ochengi]